MKTLSASDARKRFGQLLDLAQAGPVRVKRRGSDVAIVLSPEEYYRLARVAQGRLGELHSESVARWKRVYEALAK